jgi:Tol biopolymer transport system component
MLTFFRGVMARDFPLAWFDRKGQSQGTLGDLGKTPRISPDGRHVAVGGRGGLNGDIWIYDSARGVGTRLTFPQSPEGNPVGSSGGSSRQAQQAAFPASRQGYPVWSPSGKEIAFASNRGGALGIYEMAADGTGTTKTLLATPGVDEVPYSWSPDGQYVAYTRSGAGQGANSSVWMLPLLGDRQAFPLVAFPLVLGDFSASKPQFSPDGHWLAYVSDEFRPA